MSPETPLDEDEFRRWRDEADQALASARREAEAGAHNWSCFLAEQAAQLALKGLLHGLGRGPWGHDLVRLGEKAEEAGAVIPGEIADAIRRVGRHYIPARYPDAHASGPPGSHYGAADAAQAVGDADALIGFVDETWRDLHG